MDCRKVGYLIKKLRLEKRMTQKQLAAELNISDKTVSKWERGFGCPDITLILELSNVLEINIEELLHGELLSNSIVGGNMKNSKYYVCPVCGNVSICTGNAQVSCCGRKCEQLLLTKATETQKMLIEEHDNEWYIFSNHPMTKENYIQFIAYVTGNQIQLIKQYPEWDLQATITKKGNGRLIWYSHKEGLCYQNLKKVNIDL